MKISKQFVTLLFFVVLASLMGWAVWTTQRINEIDKDTALHGQEINRFRNKIDQHDYSIDELQFYIMQDNISKRLKGYNR